MHKLLEEIVTGEVREDVGVLTSRASELRYQLAGEHGVETIDPVEAARTAIAALTIPWIHQHRAHLLAEYVVLQSCQEGDEEVITCGVADAVVVGSGHKVVDVVDWKSDVRPDPAIIQKYENQVKVYRNVLSAQYARLLFLTDRKLISISYFFTPVAGEATVSRVSYFQRFSQPENHVTNNTMLVFRYLYELSPIRLQRLLTSLLEREFAVGLSFEQQVKMGKGVPDALILQEPLRIFIETKHHGTLDAAQIRRHCEGIAGTRARPGDILIGLTKAPLSKLDRDKLIRLAAGYHVTFVTTTFSGIVSELRLQCAEFERELAAMIDDYEAFLADEKLLHDQNRFLFVNPCGTSVADNVKYSLYYEPASRRLASNCRYFGIYKDRAVSYVGVIAAIAVATTNGKGEQTFQEEAGKLTDEQTVRISEVINVTKYYDLAANPNRFYLSDQLFPTMITKTSPTGIRGRIYLSLPELITSYNAKKDYTGDELAALLVDTSWN